MNIDTSCPKDLSEFLSTTKSKLPKFRADAYFCSKSKTWALKTQLKEARRGIPQSRFEPAFFQCELSPSSVAKCRVCGGKIMKGDLRICYAVSDPRGSYGCIAAWLHPACATVQSREIYLSPDVKDVENAQDSAGDDSAKSEIPGGGAVRNNSTSAKENFIEFLRTYCKGLDYLEDPLKEEMFSILSRWMEPDYDQNQEGVVNMEEFVKRTLTQRHPPPKELTVNLLAFQQEGLAWMVNQELNSHARGGVLADEMGMGKTIQAIALVLANRIHGSNDPRRSSGPRNIFYEAPKPPTLNEALEEAKPMAPLSESVQAATPEDQKGKRAKKGKKTKIKKEAKVSQEVDQDFSNNRCDGDTLEKLDKLTLEGGTLVVAPLAAVLQWEGEIERFTTKGTLEVLIYHGSQRGLLENELTRADVVITTYATIESDYRRVVNRYKLACDYCGGRYLPGKLRLHLLHFCGPDAQRTEKQALKERKQTSATSKALKTLNLGDREDFVPTISNVYREIMLKADRVQEAEDLSAAPWLSFKSRRKRQRDIPATPTSHISGEEAATPPSTNSAASPLHPDAEEPSNQTDLRKNKLIRKQGEHEMTRSPQKDKSTDTRLAPKLKRMTIHQLKEFAERQGLSDSISKANRKADIVAILEDSSRENTEGSAVKPRRTSLRQSVRKKVPVEETVLSGSDSPVYDDSEDDLFENSDSSHSDDDDSVMSEEESDTSEISENESRSACFEVDTQSRQSTVAKSSTKKKGKKAGVKKSPLSSSVAASSQGERSDAANFVMGEDLMEDDVDLSSSPLHNIKWGRIILDEAHRIKSRTTSTAKGVFALPSDGTRWCLTGTPLQNRVGELYSLIRFIRFHPYAYYFCSKKGCGCQMLNYSFKENRWCSKCQHTKMVHFSYFNKKIAKPIMSYGYSGEGRLALDVLRTEVLDEIVLRRTKVERAEDVRLPSLNIFIRREELSHDEMDFYEALYKQSKTKFDTYVSSGTVLHNFAHIFDLLSRLRQAVDHPYLIVHGSLVQTGESSIPSKSRGESDTCGICLEDISVLEQCTAKCLHSFHRLCIREFVESAPDSTKLGCPVCYSTLIIHLGGLGEDSTGGIFPESNFTTVSEASSMMAEEQEPKLTAKKAKSIMSKIKVEAFQSSTKIELLIQELNEAFANDATGKAIVFSQFTNMLELIEFRVKREGISCVVLTGALSMEARHNILTAFNTDPGLRVILISLKAGGEGLNLQIANSIFLMDPWWNPAAEMQAIQRAHRIGQTKPVKAVRFIAKNTIEERILQLQEKKQLVFEGTVGASAAAFQKLTSNDLRFLFG